MAATDGGNHWRRSKLQLKPQLDRKLGQVGGVWRQGHQVDAEQ
jgi:hypothetical protein